MKAIAENDDLKDALPRTYTKLDKELLVSLLKTFSETSMDIEGDAFGKIYEYFLGKFAMSEGQKGGEFFTPTSIVKLIVEIIEPFRGRIYNPWGLEGDEKDCEFRPELHTGVHAEMTGQTAGRKMSEPTCIYGLSQKPRINPTVAYAQCLSFGAYLFERITKSVAARRAKLTTTCVSGRNCTLSVVLRGEYWTTK